MSEIAIAWDGLTHYAALCLKEVLRRSESEITIVSSISSRPPSNAEATIGKRVYWVDRQSPISWSDLNLKTPSLFVQGSWSSKAHNTLGNLVRNQGGSVVMMMDNCWKGSLRQIVGAGYFRARRRSQFAATWVPGKSGRKLSRALGFPERLTFDKLYGADPKAFPEGPPLPKRPKRLLFAGQLIERKGVEVLAKAFESFARSNQDWSLDVCGKGPLEHLFQNINNVVLHGHTTPKELAEAMSNARFLVLPSYEEHWGVVVHEAALSGCGLLLSKNVAAGQDLLSKSNGEYFSPGNPHLLKETMERASNYTDDTLQNVFEASLTAAQRFGPGPFADQFAQMCGVLGHHC
ncbi:MAG: glycosyltransferase [Verrucomicrobiota bacterium]